MEWSPYVQCIINIPAHGEIRNWWSYCNNHTLHLSHSRAFTVIIGQILLSPAVIFTFVSKRPVCPPLLNIYAFFIDDMGTMDWFCVYSSKDYFIFRDTQVVIIDEISMMSKDLLEKVDIVFKMARVRRIVTISEHMHTSLMKEIIQV